MKAIRIISIILAVLGLALLITAFLLLGQGLGKQLLWLDIIVSSAVYCVFWLSGLGVIGRYGQPSQLGASWVAVSIYAIAAISVMGAGAQFGWTVTVQALTQGALALGFAGLILVVKSIGSHTAHVNSSQEAASLGLADMRRALDELMSRHSDARLEAIATDLRFASPVSAPEGNRIASQFVSQAALVGTQLAVRAETDGVDRLADLAKAYKNCYSV